MLHLIDYDFIFRFEAIAGRIEAVFLASSHGQVPERQNITSYKLAIIPYLSGSAALGLDFLVPWV